MVPGAAAGRPVAHCRRMNFARDVVDAADPGRFLSTVQTGMMRVLPGDADHSYLLVAIGGASGTPPEGTVMPWGGLPMLCTEEIDAIRRWVNAGANP